MKNKLRVNGYEGQWEAKGGEWRVKSSGNPNLKIKTCEYSLKNLLELF